VVFNDYLAEEKRIQDKIRQRFIDSKKSSPAKPVASKVFRSAKKQGASDVAMVWDRGSGKLIPLTQKYKDYEEEDKSSNNSSSDEDITETSQP